MERKIVSRMLTLLLMGMLTLAFNVRQAEALEPPLTEWTRTYGGASMDIAQSVVETGDGGYAITGYTDSFGAGSLDLWLVKTDADGIMQWNQTYGGVSDDRGQSVVQTVDGGYAIAGLTRSSGAGDADFWLVKTDSSGGHQWNMTYGGINQDVALSLVQTSDGGYAMVGDTFSSGEGESDFWLLKTDSVGNILWNQTYGGADGDYARSVQQTSDEGYVITGWTLSFGAGGNDFWLVKTDSLGNLQWNRTYGGIGSDAAYSVVQTDDGGYALAGRTYSFGPGDSAFWLVKTDVNGNMLWNKTYGGTGHDAGKWVQQTSDGGYIITGTTWSFGAGWWDFWLVKTDSDGNMLWDKTFGGANEDTAYYVVETSDEGYALAGYTQSFGAGSYDFWLVKVAAPVVTATVDVDPDALRLKSKGEWITAYVELPEGHNVDDIDISTVELNGEIPAELHPTEIGDYDDDGTPDLMVKFNRQNLTAILGVGEATLTITGEVNGTPFEGCDTIRVIDE